MYIYVCLWFSIVCTYMYICIYMHIYIYVYMYIYVYIYVYIYIYAYGLTLYICIYCLYILYVYIVCICVYIVLYIHVCIYIHIYTYVCIWLNIENGEHNVENSFQYICLLPFLICMKWVNIYVYSIDMKRKCCINPYSSENTETTFGMTCNYIVVFIAMWIDHTNTKQTVC